VVVDYNYTNFSPYSRNHTRLANSIKEAFLYLKNEFHNVSKYGVIGHGIGGKIALMVAAMAEHNDSYLEFVLALDPIDKSPVQIANGSLNFSKCKFPIFVTNTGSVKINGASDIYSRHTGCIKILHHSGAGHLAYCDGTSELPYWNHRLNRGTGERNTVIKRRTIKTITTSFRWDRQPSLDPREEFNYRNSLAKSILEINESTVDLDSNIDVESESNDETENRKVSWDAKVHVLSALQESISHSSKVNNSSTDSTDSSGMNDTNDKNNNKVSKKKKKPSLKRGLKKTGKVLGTIFTPF